MLAIVEQTAEPNWLKLFEGTHGTPGVTQIRFFSSKFFLFLFSKKDFCPHLFDTQGLKGSESELFCGVPGG